MSIRKTLSWLYHLCIKRDIVGPMSLSKYGSIGKNTILYKPAVTDRNKKLIEIGDNTTILTGSRFQIYPKTSESNSHIKIGSNCYFGYRNTILAGGNIDIEDGVLMASDILISSENHSANPESNIYYMDQPLICADVRICEGSWIGEKVCILPGVIIGKKCIIGAGAVVTKSVPDYSIAVGSPARVIKKYDFEQHRWTKISDKAGVKK